MNEKLSEARVLIQQTVMQATKRVYGTPSPRSARRFEVSSIVPPYSSAGVNLCEELQARAPLFLAELGLKQQEWSVEDWNLMLTQVSILCKEDGLTILEDGTLAGSTVMLEDGAHRFHCSNASSSSKYQPRLSWEIRPRLKTVAIAPRDLSSSCRLTCLSVSLLPASLKLVALDWLSVWV